MSVVAGITAAKASLELTTKILDLVNRPQIDAADVRGKVHEMLIHLVNAQVALGEAHVEISDLRRQLEERDGLKALDADMEFQIDGGFYVRKSEAGRGLIPYCPVCWKKEGQTIPLQNSGKPGRFWCIVHKSAYTTAEYREAEKARTESVRDSVPTRSAWLDR